MLTAKDLQEVYKKLLPPGSLWVPIEDEDFDNFYEGKGENAKVIYDFLNSLAYIRNPQKTPILSDLEKEYGLITSTTLSEQDRRDQLDAIVYAKAGTGSDTNLQDALQAAGFDVKVFQNTDPELDPADFLQDAFLMEAGGADAFAGEPEAIAGKGGGELVVNGDIGKYSVEYTMQADGGEAFAGEPEAIAGYFTNVTFEPVTYSLPVNDDTFRYVFFVAGERLLRPEISKSDKSMVSTYRMRLDKNDYVPNLVPGAPRAKNNGATHVLTELGDSFYFDGASYVDCGDGFNDIDGVAVEFWFKMPDVSVTCRLFNKYFSTSDAWGIALSSSTIRIFDDIDNAGASIYATAIYNNTWHHVMSTMGSITYENKLYLDGSLVGSGINSSDNWASFAGNLYLGQRGNGTAFFDGQMTDPIIYKEEKTESYASSQYQKGLAVIAENQANGFSSGSIIYGSELITNGHFTTDLSGWTDGGEGGGFGQTGGKARGAGGEDAYSTLYQDIATEIGRSYRITGEIDITQTDSFGAVFAGTVGSPLTTNLGSTYSSTSFDTVFVATATTTRISLYGNEGSAFFWQVDFDNISMNEKTIIPDTFEEFKRADIPQNRKDVFNKIILKQKPLHSWAGLLVDYV